MIPISQETDHDPQDEQAETAENEQGRIAQLQEAASQRYHQTRDLLTNTMEHMARHREKESVVTRVKKRFSDQEPNFTLNNEDIDLQGLHSILQQADTVYRKEPLAAWDPSLSGKPSDTDIQEGSGEKASYWITTYDDDIELRVTTVSFAYSHGQLRFSTALSGRYDTEEAHDGKVIRSEFSGDIGPVITNDRADQVYQDIINSELDYETRYSGATNSDLAKQLLEDTDTLQIETSQLTERAESHMTLDEDGIEDRAADMVDTLPASAGLTIDQYDGQLTYQVRNTSTSLKRGQGRSLKTYTGTLDIDPDMADEYLQELGL